MQPPPKPQRSFQQAGTLPLGKGIRCTPPPPTGPPPSIPSPRSGMPRPLGELYYAFSRKAFLFFLFATVFVFNTTDYKLFVITFYVMNFLKHKMPNEYPTLDRTIDISFHFCNCAVYESNDNAKHYYTKC